jgi:hypothetical protein
MDAENIIDATNQSEEQEHVEQTRLLFLASNPSDLAPLMLEKEFIEIRKLLRNKKNTFDISEAFDVSLDLFFEEIAYEQPHIIHFTGYGSENALVFSRKIDRTQHYVPYEFLASSLKLIRGNTECVFINTLGSDLFAKVVSRYIPYAIGVSGYVLDDEAISFSSGFYAALAIEKDYEKAFKNGKELFLAQKKLAKSKALKNKEKTDVAKNEEDTPLNKIKKIPSNYFLFKNGFSEDENDLPNDFYIPKMA